MKKQAKGCFTFLLKIAVFLFVLSIAFTAFFRVILVDGDSMLPTFQNGDWILILKTEKIENQDIILTNTDNEFNLRIIKRVIAFEGDTVDIDFENSAVYVNSQKIEENYITDLPFVKGDVEFPVTVPKDCVFVLGDNRQNSVDSRYSSIGFVETDDIIGKVIWP